ncbi:hypothetical protein N0V88_003718 [Collariella sp. IMI 366227]|nr:hypothetical protein N0V88_003718 [Collariella sp. IMI 366227]
MADLIAGSGPAVTNGHATSSHRPTAPPTQTGSPQQVIRGPRMIMRERAEREARQRAEREQMERARAEEEARLIEETQRRATEHRQPVAGAVSSSDIHSDPATQRRQQQAERNPISTQLSRQVADLSAAGANLFHAVVELQRLRASSERKFQRWFFETRAELERHQEVNAMLEAQMEQERQARADAARVAAQSEAESMKLQKLVNEMRRELLISKEEARRAWEELGRREQEERDRTVSLQQGHPTIVGGVQVVPMTQGMGPSRAASRHNRSHSHAVDTSDYSAAQGGQYPTYTSPPPPVVQPPTSAGDPMAGYFPQPGAAGQEPGDYGPGSDTGYSEGEYMIDARGQYLRDENGNRIPFHSPTGSLSRARRPDAVSSEDYPTPGSQPTPTSYPPSSSQWAGYAAGAPEYSGQGFAPAGWEQMPRHHHPTRLSDVMEEDERSRTSISQVSRA